MQAILVMLALAASAASPIEGGEQAATRPSAAELTRQADAALRTGRLEEAHAAAQESFALLPTARTAYNLAVIQLELGLGQRAFEQLIAGLNLEPAPEEARLSEELLARIGPTLQPPRGWLAIATTPPGAAVAIDGESTPAATPLVVGAAAGAHTVTVQLEGYGGLRPEVEIVAGQGSALALTLAQAPASERANEAQPLPAPSAPEEPAAAVAPSSGPAGGATPGRPIEATGAGRPPASQRPTPALVAGIGAGVGVGGLVALLGFGYGVYAYDQLVRNDAAPWEDRYRAALLGTAMGVGAVVSTALIAAGGWITTWALISGDEDPRAQEPTPSPET